MRIFIYLYILKLIAHVESRSNPKAVNLQLETVLEFNDNDKEADVKFIGNIQKILKKVKTALTPESGRRINNKYNKNIRHNLQFTDFILAAVDILLSYDDDDLEHAFAIINDEIRKYHYKGCKFYELVEDENVRKFVGRNLDSLKNNKATALRKKLYKLINILGNSKLNTQHRNFLDYIDSLYSHESSSTFINILQNLENYRYKSKRSNMNLVEITRGVIRSILFDYFSKLNPNVRKDIKKNIEKTWNPHQRVKSKHNNENNETDLDKMVADENHTYDRSKEDEKDLSSSLSNEFNKHVKIKVPNNMDTTPRKLKKAIKNKRPFLTRHPANNTHKLYDQEYKTEEVKLEPSFKEPLVLESNKRKDDLIISTNKSERDSHSFERQTTKEKFKRNKQKKKRISNVEVTQKEEDDVRVARKIKKNKHRKLKANEEKKESSEDTVIVKAPTNNLRSESLMKRPNTESNKEFIINLNNMNENRDSDKDLETKASPRKRKDKIMRRQFMMFPTANQNTRSLSDEGMSIEYGHYRRKMTSDKESELEKEKDVERHKKSAELIRTQFINRINNLEKQMEEVFRKIDDTPRDYLTDIEITTEKKAESSIYSSNNDKLNITVKTKGTTQNYHIIIGPEYIPYKNETSDEIKDTNSTEVKTNNSTFTDNSKTNTKGDNNFSVSQETRYFTDFDYSEIMKKLNITLSKESPIEKEKVVEENPKKSDEEHLNGEDNGLHRIEIPLDNEIIHNNNTTEMIL